MMKRFSLIFLALLSYACTPEVLTPDSPSDPPREPVPVSLSLTAAPLEGEALATKADLESQIKSVGLVQFEWIDDDPAHVLQARMVSRQYFDHYPLVEADGENFALVSSNRKNTVLVIANAREVDLSFGMEEGAEEQPTFDEILTRQNATLLATPSLDDLWYSDGADNYLRMSASVVLDGVAITPVPRIGTDSDPLQLKRNCAKVTVNVTNETSGPDAVTIDQVRLCSVNRRYYLAAHLDGGIFRDVYSPSQPQRFDAEPEAFSGPSQTYTFYVPLNLRGDNGSSTQTGKNLNAPAGATCFRLYGHYGADSPVVYTYYLGGDLVSDFNLEANKSYTYDITLSAKGDPDSDSRVEDLGEIRILTDANCYMLQAPEVPGMTYTYAIPVRRAAVFWNSPGTNMGVYGAASYEAAPFSLEEDTAWTPAVVWKTMVEGDVSDDAFLLTPTGSGMGFNPDHADPPAGHQPWLRVRVPYGMRGNALVAIKDGAGNILWSWHIWVTDYNPDVPMTPEAGTYVYGVPGGEIHRYNNAAFNTGEYSQAFMMDRNLGANTVWGTTAATSQGYRYQLGRKDPFLENFSHPALASSVADGRNVRYGVQHPNVWFRMATSADQWTSPQDPLILKGTYANWFDRLYNEHGGDNCEPGKSIYDPCPPGWRLPLSTVWTGIITTSQWSTVDKGLLYYPEGYDNRAASGVVFLPAGGWASPANHWRRGGAGLIGAYHCANGGKTILNFRADGQYQGITNDYDEAALISARCIRLQ